MSVTTQGTSFALILGKVMEQIILESISEYEQRMMVGRSQHVCMKGKSYLTNLTAFHNEMTALVGERRAADAVYINFSRSFASLPHEVP